MSKPIFLLAAGALCAVSVIAQPTLTLNGTTSFIILPGTPVSLNGLVLTPAANFSIAAPNQLNKNVILTNAAASANHIARVYKWSNTLNAFDGAIDFYYTDGELNGIPEASLALQVHTGSLWQSFTANVTRNAATNLVTTDISNVTLNELTLIDEATLLPLQWGSIIAYRQHGKGMVKWIAWGVEPGDHFIVERSRAGTNWQSFTDSIPAYTTSGNHQYIAEDASVPDERTFYRIKLVHGNSNAESLSRMVMVPPVLTEAVVVYPNPVKDRLILQSTGAAIQEVKMYSTTGKLVYSIVPGNVFFYSFNTQLLMPGYYRLQVCLANGTTVWRAVIEK